MKSKYKFCDLIEEVKEYNTELQYGLNDIVGVTIEKGLIPTVANLQQTSLEKFYIVKPKTFIYNPRTHGVRLGMGYNNTEKIYITTWNNVAFKVKKSAESILNPDYLWIYFNRSEWDRETNYHAWGSSTIVFSWNTFLNLQIEIPPKNVQDKICKAYKTITDRIALKQRINDNLEETAKAIFKAHFVSFEFYGGTMPKSWTKATIDDVVSVTRGASPRPIQDYMSENGMPWVKISDASSSISKYLFSTAEFIIPEGVKSSRTVTPGMMILSNSASPGLPMLMEITACVHDGWLIIDDYKSVSQEYMYYHFLNERQSLVSSSNGSVFNNLKTDIVKAHQIIIPDKNTMQAATNIFCVLNKSIKQNAQEINALIKLKNNILSQMSYN